MSTKVYGLGDQVAQAVRRRREQLGLTLRELATKSGVSASMISDLERGAKSPTLATLAAVAMALDTSLVTMLEGAAAARPRLRVLRASDARPTIERRSRVRRQDLVSMPMAGRATFVRYVVPAGKSAGPFAAHPAGTLEHVHLEAGRIEFVLGSKSVTLTAGDSCSCFADASHTFDNSNGKFEARFYVVAESPLARAKLQSIK
ncbi:MAG: XRE family transcriptional regulator [Reyranella sp.]|nr:XRE family transcriptional regulator [Reyranella sp.]